MKRGQSTGFRFEVPQQESYLPKYIQAVMGFMLLLLMSISMYKDYKLGVVTDLISQQNMVLL
jgi:hypothetical protein